MVAGPPPAAAPATARRAPSAPAPPATESLEAVIGQKWVAERRSPRMAPRPARREHAGGIRLTAEGAARQVVFDGASAAPGVMRLYYGGARALAPRYDLAARVPAESGPMADRLVLGPKRDNPAYRPEPKPFSERSPWLVYVVLAAAGIVLAAILVSLARASAASALRDPSDRQLAGVYRGA